MTFLLSMMLEEHEEKIDWQLSLSLTPIYTINSAKNHAQGEHIHKSPYILLEIMF